MKLVKTISGKDNFIYFKRWRIFNFFNLVCLDLHEFFLPNEDNVFDKDDYLHNHPRIFISLILFGGYEEQYKKNKDLPIKIRQLRKWNFNFGGISLFHKIGKLLEKKNGKFYCKTLVLTTRNLKDWGYLKDGKIISNEEYRDEKHKTKIFEKS